jgi:hypothetical protein
MHERTVPDAEVLFSERFPTRGRRVFPPTTTVTTTAITTAIVWHVSVHIVSIDLQHRYTVTLLV